MRKVTRSTTAPASLTSKIGGKTELERAEAHQLLPVPPSGKKKAFKFLAYKGADVKQSLDDVFFRKCAYCESRYETTAPVDIEHFRPKGRVKEDKAHSGYWWLAMSWDNLLPACIECNRHRKQDTPMPSSGKKISTFNELLGKFSYSRKRTTGKQDSFPVIGPRLVAQATNFTVEQALLINPCDDDPALHLAFYIDRARPFGLVLPKPKTGQPKITHLTPSQSSVDTAAIMANAVANNTCPRGAVSIQTYGLNRLQLVRERTRTLRRLEFLEHQAVALAKLIEELNTHVAHPTCRAQNARAANSLVSMQDMVLKQIREMAKDEAPYSAMVNAWIEDFVQRAAL